MVSVAPDRSPSVMNFSAGDSHDEVAPSAARALGMPSQVNDEVFVIDPLLDPRWVEFIERHPESSIFHSPGWLRTLQRTYGYQPVVLTTTQPGHPLKNGVVLCRVDSWITGCRMVSLPFSDHCQPLLSRHEEFSRIVGRIGQLSGRNCSYVEVRPLASSALNAVEPVPFFKSEEYYWHKMDLRPDEGAIFGNFHKSCIQRKIRRAEREGLQYEAGQSESLLARFYKLQLITRRRHNLPPQPMAWFRNLADCLGSKLTIRLVSKDERPIAGMLTLSHKSTLVYKYGCSDSRWNQVGGMPLLFWKAVQEGKRLGATEFDLGRSDTGNGGLATFKERLGAHRYRLSYLRLLLQPSRGQFGRDRLRVTRGALAWLPLPVVRLAGRILYRHMG